MSLARRNGGVSFWYASTTMPAPRPPLRGDREADVVIAGGGYTGLWTAYHLTRARPDLEVVVLERAFAGYGASGRNGGWLSDHFATPSRKLEATHGRDGVVAQHGAMRHAIDEVLGVCREEGIDADIVRSGELRVARGPAQARRLAAAIAERRAWGGGDGLVELDAEATRERVRVAGATAAFWSPHCARVQPAKLVQGLAAAAERRGATIHESTTVTELRPGAAVTDRGTVRAPTVLSCLEGFTASLKGRRRARLPLNSALVVTEPLPDAVWEQIGWAGEEVLGDAAHVYFYAQRTADGRIAMGGRGVPYRFGSTTDRDGATQATTIRRLVALLHEMFPATVGIPIAHAWCGVLGVDRDWAASVRLDRATGLGEAGGYVGSGVTTANLAGRTLCDLVLGRDSELVRLPWVGHASRSWEPEPLRWMGARLVYGLYRAADRSERRSGAARTSAFARAADLISGR